MTIDPRMTRTRAQLIVKHPFFGFLATRLRIVTAPRIGTMATDGVRWLYDPAYLDRCDNDKLLFTGAHEVVHCALNHPTRRGNRDHDTWNEACDHVDNLILKKAGFVVPSEALCDAQFEGMGVEDVYRVLKAKKQEKDSRQGSGGGGGEDGESNNQGSGSGDSRNDGGDPGDADTDPSTPSSPISDPGGCGAVIDAAPQDDQAALDNIAEEWNVAVRQAANFARRQGEGKLPGFVQEIISQLNRPKVDWRDTLRTWIEPSSTKDYTWTKPNRRMLPFNIISPGTTTDGIHHVGIAVDTSGSISTEMVQQFTSEVQAAIDDGKIDKVTVVLCDDQVQGTTEYVMGDTIDLRVQGRGGTRFSPAFKWFEDNAPDVAGVIYLTDLDCHDFGPEPSYRVLWAGYETHPMLVQYLRRRMEVVPFGECIELC